MQLPVSARCLQRFALIVLLWQAPILLAQERPLAFKHLTIDDGLSQGMVLAIHQDRQGFMWFGTKDGLNRYDGYRFTVFRHDPFDSTSLSNNYIQAIFEDRRGRLWIGTAEGLNCFDRETEKFRRFLHDAGQPRSLSDNNIYAICEAPVPVNEAKDVTVLWIGTINGGLNKLVLRENDAAPDYDFITYQHHPADPNSLSSNRVWSLLVDQAGILWIGTDRGLCRLNPPHSLSPADDQQVKFTRYVHNETEKASLLDNYCSTLEETRDGAIWIGTRKGLSRMTPANPDSPSQGSKGRSGHGTFENYDYSITPVLPQAENFIVDICEDRRGALWLATYLGLLVFDPQKTGYRWIRHDAGDPASLSYDGVRAIYRDRSGAMWIGTMGFGLSRWDPQLKQFHAYTSEKLNADLDTKLSISALLEDRRGVTWIFTGDDWYQLNRQTGSVAYRPLKFVSPETKALYEDPDLPLKPSTESRSFLWITNNTGAFRYDPRVGQIEKIFPQPGEPPFGLDAIYADNNGDLWFGSSSRLSDNAVTSPRPSFKTFKGESGHALYHWNRQTEQVTAYPLLIPETIKGEWLMIVGITQDQSDAFWLATNQGLFRFDPPSGALKIFRNEPSNRASVNNNEVKTLLADPRQPERFLWLGTNGGGLNRFDVATESFSHYTEEHGLPNNVVYGLLADDAGNLWMSTNKGLSKAVLTPDTRAVVEFKNYDVGDGLQSNEFNTNAYFKNGRGEMFFGGIKGFNVFHPDSIRENSYVPPVVITGLKRYNADAEGIAIVEKGVSARKEITLSYKDNIIAFEFAALNFQNPEKNQYAYKLAGYSDQWIQLGTKREVTFTNLDPGEYFLRVKGSNNDGVWNEEGASIKITVTPPWWKTWWAYAFYVLLVTGLLYGLRRYETNRMLWKNRVKIENLEAEKLRELDRLKTRFFANISHEFRTPLTLIIGQLDSVKTLVAEVKLKTKLDMAWRNAQQLLRLINQLLDLSKLEAGRMELRAVYGNIVPLLQRLTNSFESLAAIKRIQLHFASASDEIKIYHEPEKIEKIMHNLLSNALKFTPEGGKVSVQLSVFSDQSSVIGNKSLTTDHCLLITVRDSGIGISKEHLPHVFDRFYQATEGSAGGIYGCVTREHEGTGIGLALTKELVELHGGEISVTSEEGFGTTFVVRLPFSVASDQLPVISNQLSVISAQDADSPSIQPSINPSLQKSIDPAIQPPATSDQDVILIVEDNADLRAYLRENLEDRFQVCEAGNGEEGLAKAQELVPDLVITDVMMPKMDGYTLSKRLKSDEKTSHIPIIMLTAKAEEADKITGLEIGVDDYLLKPFSPNELRVRVRNLIEIRRRLRERFSQTVALKPSTSGAISMEDAFLRKVLAAVEKHLGDEDFGVEALGQEVGMSRTQIHRKLKALTNQTASELIRSLRLQRAAELLQRRAGTVAEIAFQVGFGDPSYFTKCFREQFGCLPTEYGKKN